MSHWWRQETVIHNRNMIFHFLFLHMISRRILWKVCTMPSMPATLAFLKVPQEQYETPNSVHCARNAEVQPYYDAYTTHNTPHHTTPSFTRHMHLLLLPYHTGQITFIDCRQLTVAEETRKCEYWLQWCKEQNYFHQARGTHKGSNSNINININSNTNNFWCHYLFNTDWYAFVAVVITDNTDHCCWW